jgi:hypothetical protein
MMDIHLDGQMALRADWSAGKLCAFGVVSIPSFRPSRQDLVIGWLVMGDAIRASR